MGGGAGTAVAGCPRTAWLLALHLSLLMLDGTRAFMVFQPDHGSDIPARLQSPLGPQTKFFFSGRHKTGCALMTRMCHHFERVALRNRSPARSSACSHILNRTSEGMYCTTNCINPPCCAPGMNSSVNCNTNPKTHKVVFYGATKRAFTNAKIVEVQHYYTNYRMVYILRDPLRVFASGFIYDQKGIFQDRGWLREEVQGLSLHEALRRKAADTKELGLMSNILEDHRRAQRDANVLEVRMEDFEANFNATVSQLFTFVHGSTDDQRRREMLDLAQHDDTSQWAPQKVSEDPHLSDPEQMDSVLEGIAELCLRNDPSVLKILAFRGPLGYSTGCPNSSKTGPAN